MVDNVRGTNGPRSGASGAKDLNGNYDYKNMTTEDLRKKLTDGNIPESEKKKIVEELLKRAIEDAQDAAKQGVPDAEAELKKLEDILKKFKAGKPLTELEEDFLAQHGIDLGAMDPNRM